MQNRTQSLEPFPERVRLARKAPFDLRGLSVLVVEDNADARDVLEAMLDYCGAFVTPAAAARAAWRRWR
jgi:hypothetical protein